MGKIVTAVAAGREHALAVTTEGRVYSWGGRPEIAGRVGDLKTPGLLGGDLLNDTVLFVAGGEYFSLAASRHRVYGWGGNNYLSLGVGRNNPVQVMKAGQDRGMVAQPAQVAGPLADGTWSILAIAAGGEEGGYGTAWWQHSEALCVGRLRHRSGWGVGFRIEVGDDFPSNEDE